MNKNIYVVFGSKGEYSDHVEWPVCACLDEEQAKCKVAALVAASNVAIAERKRLEDAGDYLAMYDVTSALDPDWKTDYTGTNYAYWVVPVEEAKR